MTHLVVLPPGLSNDSHIGKKRSARRVHVVVHMMKKSTQIHVLLHLYKHSAGIMDNCKRVA